MISSVYVDNADLWTDQWVNCGPDPQVWSAVYLLVGPQVHILSVPGNKKQHGTYRNAKEAQ